MFRKQSTKKMKLAMWGLLGSLLFFSIPVSYAHLPVSANQPETASLAPILKNVLPAVVQITVEKEAALGQSNPDKKSTRPNTPSISIGSGVIIQAENGLIVTNAHVVSKGRLIIVTLENHRRYRAKIVGEDDGFDIAIIQIHANNLASLPFGDSDQIHVGDFVAAVGSPFGFTQTVTSGVISALNRDEPKIEGYQNFIQTDTPINLGNSGGALINLKGELIGINTAIFTPSLGSIGIGFAVPSNTVKSVTEQLLQYGKVSRGMLGVIVQDITPPLADAMSLPYNQGVVISKVVPETPADQAGMKTSDIILKVNGKIIASAQQLRNTLGLMRPGTSIELTISHQGKTRDLTTIVGNPESILKQKETPFLAGLQLQDFKELEGDGEYLTGVVVANVSDTSAGALAGLLPGDVITQANTQNIISVDQLKKIAENRPKQMLLQITRGESVLFLVIEPEESGK